MTNKLTVYFFTFLLIHQCVLAQNNKVWLGPTITPTYEKLGAIHKVAGIIADNYFVVENDYGGAMDFKNNIRTSISSYSVKNGNFKKNFSLNDIVAQSRKEIDKILFCDVAVWKDKLISFYTYKNPSGKTFLASALLCDPNGRPIKTNIDIGEFVHDYADGSFMWQGGLLVNGRNTLSVTKNFQYRFTPDSSKIIVLCTPPKDNTGNIRFKIFDTNLDLVKEAAAIIPFQQKVVDLVQFSMDNNGKIYLITRTNNTTEKRNKVSNDDDYGYTLYSINTVNNNTVENLSLEMIDRSIVDANIGYAKNNIPIVAGTYTNGVNKKTKGQIHGAFTVMVDPVKLKSSVKSMHDFPREFIEEYESSKALKRGGGISQLIRVKQFLPKADGGMFIIGRNDYVEVVVRGSTGAMNSFYEKTGSMFLLSINANGKVLWEKPFADDAANLELATRIDRTQYSVKENELIINFVSAIPDKKGLWQYTYNNSGEIKKDLLIPAQGDLVGFTTIENTLLQINESQDALLLFKEGRRGKDSSIKMVKLKR